MDANEHEDPKKIKGRAILPPKKIRDIKREIGEDTTTLLNLIRKPLKGDAGSLPAKTKQESIVEKTLSEYISESRIINVKKRPSTENLIEVRNLNELKKIGKTLTFINRYENDKDVIYFVDNYFYRVDKR
jgi:hypothetical protein